VGISTSAPDFGNLSTTGFNLLNNKAYTRIRQNGTVDHFSIYIGTVPAQLTAFYIEVWRKDGSTWDRQCQSQNFLSSLANNQTNNLTPISTCTVQEGDYVGLSWTTSGTPDTNFLTRVASNNGSYYISDTDIGAADYNWASIPPNTKQNYVIPIKTYMRAPVFSAIGDSWISGVQNIDGTGNYGLCSNTVSDFNPNNIPTGLGTELDYTYQNMGLYANLLVSQISTRFQADVVDKKPKFVVVDGGANDLLADENKSNFLTAWTNILNLCQLNNIVPIVNLMYPVSDFTNVQQQTKIDWNDSLRTLAESYDAIIVDASTYVGQFRAGGDPDNLWDQQAIYSGGDNLHYNAAGYAKITDAIIDAINAAEPTIANSSPSGTIADSTPTLSVTTSSDYGTVTCKYAATDTDYDSMTAMDDDGNNHIVTLSALVDGSYDYYIRCQDANHNTNTDAEHISFTTDTIVAATDNNDNSCGSGCQKYKELRRKYKTIPDKTRYNEVKKYKKINPALYAKLKKAYELYGKYSTKELKKLPQTIQDQVKKYKSYKGYKKYKAYKEKYS